MSRPLKAKTTFCASTTTVATRPVSSSSTAYSSSSTSMAPLKPFPFSCPGSARQKPTAAPWPSSPRAPCPACARPSPAASQKLRTRGPSAARQASSSSNSGKLIRRNSRERAVTRTRTFTPRTPRSQKTSSTSTSKAPSLTLAGTRSTICRPSSRTSTFSSKIIGRRASPRSTASVQLLMSTLLHRKRACQCLQAPILVELITSL
mmetsp:Transcript_22874/g.51585  ORF Transcript_22874/g.51585 Transcript_22874/m.51585 type:complete len:205 (-) Transcript_22874:338-952(-)